MTNELDALVEMVLASPKYRTLTPALIRRIGRRELEVRPSFKEAVKATKNKLHQVAGAYFDTRLRYDTWLADLEAAVHSDDLLQLQHTCRRIMGYHVSTRERIDILETFYTKVFAALPPIRAVLDVACGFNPLAMPWMPLTSDAQYYACDLYDDLVMFLNRFFQITGLPGNAHVCDLLSDPPQQQVDLALVLKVLPPLEQIEKQAGLMLLRSLKADAMLVTFPAHSLGGRDKRMAENYEQHFRRLIADEPWSVERFVFANELGFLVRTSR